MAAASPGAGSAAARTGTQSVERAFAVLRAVTAAHRGGASVAAVMQAARLNRSTTYRMLKCLTEQGAIRFDERLPGYVLGPLALDLALAAREQLSFKELFAAELAQVAEKTGDTVFLLIRSEDDLVCIDRQLGPYPVKTLVVEIGTRRPLGIGAGATAILGAMTDEEARRVVLRNSASLAAFGTSAGAVLKAAAAARRLGHAVQAPHGIDGVTALAVAAISRRMGRQRQEQSLKVLRAAAQACRQKLQLR